jgi:hypothetical protein
MTDRLKLSLENMREAYTQDMTPQARDARRLRARRKDFKSTSVEPDYINWLGIEPNEFDFTEAEILDGEVLCARVNKTVVYLAREQTGLRTVTAKFKITSWTEGRLVHRSVHADLDKAKRTHAMLKRGLIISLATELLG